MWTRPLGTNLFIRARLHAEETTELVHHNLMAQFSCVTQNPHYTTGCAGRLPGGELRSSAGKTDRTGYLFVTLVIFINVMPRVLACPRAVFVLFFSPQLRPLNKEEIGGLGNDCDAEDY